MLLGVIFYYQLQLGSGTGKNLKHNSPTCDWTHKTRYTLQAFQTWLVTGTYLILYFPASI